MNTYPQGRTITIGPESLYDAGDFLVEADDADLTLLAPDGTESNPTVTEPSFGVYEAQGVTLDAPGRWRYVWTFTIGSDVSVRPGEFFAAAGLPFATLDDVEGRLGIVFTDAQVTQCERLILSLAGLIADAADKDETWAFGLDPVPAGLQAFTVEKVAAAMTAPLGVRSQQEQLGAYSHSTSYQDTVTGMVALTDAEVLNVRRIVYRSNSGSGTAETVLNRLYELDE